MYVNSTFVEEIIATSNERVSQAIADYSKVPGLKKEIVSHLEVIYGWEGDTQLVRDALGIITDDKVREMFNKYGRYGPEKQKKLISTLLQLVSISHSSQDAAESAGTAYKYVNIAETSIEILEALLNTAKQHRDIKKMIKVLGNDEFVENISKYAGFPEVANLLTQELATYCDVYSHTKTVEDMVQVMGSEPVVESITRFAGYPEIGKEITLKFLNEYTNSGGEMVKNIAKALSTDYVTDSIKKYADPPDIARNVIKMVADYTKRGEHEKMKKLRVLGHDKVTAAVKMYGKHPGMANKILQGFVEVLPSERCADEVADILSDREVVNYVVNLSANPEKIWGVMKIAAYTHDEYITKMFAYTMNRYATTPEFVKKEKDPKKFVVEFAKTAYNIQGDINIPEKLDPAGTFYWIANQTNN